MSYINVIVDCERFLSLVKRIALKYNVYCYFEYRAVTDRTKRSYLKVDFNLENYSELLNEAYGHFFFISKEVAITENLSFYDDGLFEFSIEGGGGKKSGHEIEILTLRLLAKNPDKRIKSFFNAINNEFKTSEDFSQGIGPSNYYKKFFYLKEFADGDFEIWNDLKNKNLSMSIVRQ
ncbi:hypothetical protein SAMN05421820_105279 [Pedobacter steynii]|uniref:Uncharacterized protein n=1 Tax=Pedobacter steynii TaxID=430522 RepID=A0A1G9WU16_9SPHI|nr:hypothetical protein [Pedobacter steynii]NQX40399.1 hypothetical protein [Pedobacter steynii]SDM88010.1 hypothetical protein SAMN05421820_105279 [Pedobacter steynii]